MGGAQYCSLALSLFPLSLIVPLLLAVKHKGTYLACDSGNPLRFAFPNILSIVEAVTTAPYSKRRQQQHGNATFVLSCAAIVVVVAARCWVGEIPGFGDGI